MTADPLESDVAMYSDNGYFDANDEFMQYMMENLKYASISKAQQNAKLTGEYAEKTLEKISRHSGVSADVLKSTFTGNVVYGTAPEKTDATTKGGMPEYYFEVVYTDWWIHEQYGPLLTTKMHREAPYNVNLKVYNVQHNARPDAIAVGQIMAYHEKPQNYMWKDTLRIFNWSQIKADYWTDTIPYNREVEIFMQSVHKMLGVYPKTPTLQTIEYADIFQILRTFNQYITGITGPSSVKLNYLHDDPNNTGRDRVTQDVCNNRPVYARGVGPTSFKHSWVIDGYKQQRRIRYNNAFYYDYDGNKIYEPSISTHSLQMDEYWHFNLGINRSYQEIYCKVGLFVFSTPNGYDFNTTKSVLTNIYPR